MALGFVNSVHYKLNIENECWFTGCRSMFFIYFWTGHFLLSGEGIKLSLGALNRRWRRYGILYNKFFSFYRTISLLVVERIPEERIAEILTILRQANEFRKGFSRKGKKTELKGLGLVVYSSSVAFFVCVKKSLAFFQTVSSLKRYIDFVSKSTLKQSRYIFSDWKLSERKKRLEKVPRLPRSK